MVLGVFQLGIIGRLIDSFFNYLFGYSRYLTYILVLLATGFITYSKRIPKTRRTAGSIVLQIALLFVSQLVFHFNSGIKAEREPVLLMCISRYQHSHFPNFGGGVLGFYLLEFKRTFNFIIWCMYYYYFIIMLKCYFINKPSTS